MKKRFALIIGAARSGTTRLFRALGAHPQVIPCRVKEPNFFTDDRKWKLGVDWYRSLWDFREPDDRVAIEASSGYAMDPLVASPAQRIARMPAGFRFLYVLRNPVERIEAEHARARADGRVPAELDAAMLRCGLEVSRYAAQLAHYRAHFPRDDFLLLHHEELLGDAAGLLRRVCGFLEIDPYVPGAASEGPADRAGRLEALRGWAARLPGLRRLARSPRRRALPAFRLPPEQRALVVAELRDDLRQLEEEWGFDTSPWELEGLR